LPAAAAVVNGLRDLISEAAEATGREIALPASSVTITAQDFISLVQLESDAGSFVWRLLVPTQDPDLPPRPFDERTTDLPTYGRLTTLIMADWLEELGGRDSRNRPVRHRQRPNIAVMRALLKIVAPAGRGAEVNFEFAWSSLVDVPRDAPEHVRFAEQDVPRLTETVRELSAVSEERLVIESRERYGAGLPGEPRAQEFEGFTLIGEVEALRRPEITVVGDVFGRTRRVRLNLASNDYELAVEAHLNEETVVVLGTLTLRARSARLSSVDHFHVVETGSDQ
jgi:hypothetical protein